MPKAILAIRTYPATLIIALVLFLATLVMTAASMGTAGVGGGDDGDGGSGIGGTGKSGEFGGSGFGGTGGPSPFITSVNDKEPTIPAPVDGDLTTGTSLSQAVTESVEQSTIVIESSSIVAGEPIQKVAEPTASVPVLLLEEKTPEMQLAEADPVAPESTGVEQAALNPAADVEVINEESLARPIDIVQQDQSNNGADLAEQSLNAAGGVESVSVKLETAAKESEQEIDRNTLPDRIQRPDLPPFQRVRPVDRASIMAPARVQPMRI